MSFDFLAAIKNVAPMLAGSLGGPFAGMAVKALIGATSSDNAEAVQQAQDTNGIEGAVAKIGELFQQGAIQTVQIKQAEQAHAERMAELGYKNAADLERIAADDRASARGREIAVRDEMPKILSAVIVLAWCLIQWHLINNSVPDDMREIVMRVLGTLDAALMLCLSYYFGTTANSGRKDDAMAAIAKSP